MTAEAAAPKLLKARQRHTRLFALLVVPMAIFCIGMAKPEELTHEIMDWTGMFLVIACVLGRTYCSAFIGGIKNEVVMRDGPFSVVRNPLYVFSFIGLVGIGLQSGMLTLLALLVGAFTMYYPAVVAKEEAFLLHKFGEQYQRYVNEVPRWVPNLRLWSEPQEMMVRPYFIRQTMMDALVFFVPMVVFELLEILHQVGWVPTVLVLP